jgi:glycine/D-amino acid oxidase-like deaminating enzyme
MAATAGIDTRLGTREAVRSGRQRYQQDGHAPGEDDERPRLTPDGLPIMDRVDPFENLFIATGHSMLGITLAPASGQALAGYVRSGQRPELLEPFRLRRFGPAR